MAKKGSKGRTPGQRVPDVAHWVERHKPTAMLERRMMADLPGKHGFRSVTVELLGGWSATWSEGEETIELTRSGADVTLSPERGKWTWGRFVAMLVTLRAVRVDLEVKGLLCQWVVGLKGEA